MYSEEIVVRFAGPDYRDFVESEGRDLRPRLARSLALADLRPGHRMLDLGCGRGEVAAHAAARRARVVALDYSPDCVQLTREATRLLTQRTEDPGPGRTEDSGLRSESSTGTTQSSALSPQSSPVDVVLADAAALPFPAEAFDRITMLDVVEHLHPWQLETALTEVRRVLRPDGFAVIHTVPNRWALDVGYPLLRLARPALPADPRTDYEHQVHVNEQDIVGLRRALARAGLRPRVWLENLTVEQARWQRNPDAFRDVRGASYGFFRHPAVRALVRAALRTPLRLIACNDIYAVAWKG
jgi:SAM-dependent methyltransferase